MPGLAVGVGVGATPHDHDPPHRGASFRADRLVARGTGGSLQPGLHRRRRAGLAAGAGAAPRDAHDADRRGRRRGDGRVERDHRIPAGEVRQRLVAAARRVRPSSRPTWSSCTSPRARRCRRSSATSSAALWRRPGASSATTRRRPSCRDWPDSRSGAQRVLHYAENTLAKRPYFAGAQFTAADIMMHFPLKLGAPAAAQVAANIAADPDPGWRLLERLSAREGLHVPHVRATCVSARHEGDDAQRPAEHVRGSKPRARPCGQEIQNAL